MIGDPQAPLGKLRAILDRHGLLGPGGRLRPEVGLISVGDHFDYGGVARRSEAAAEGLAVLDWLAAHPVEQVVILAGNHDLARVGELAGFDDAAFAAARQVADACYDPAREAAELRAEAALKARFPALPSAELAARDYAAFTAAQRERVLELLRSHRMRAAVAVGRGLLVTHAGVAAADLEAAGLAPARHADAPAAAAALNAALAGAVAAWRDGPLAIPGLHTPGDAAGGEGGGIFYHRPADPDRPADAHPFSGPRRRRFDPRQLPRGLTQVIGHVGDAKCRALMPRWCDAAPPRLGVLRQLSVPAAGPPRYAHGVPAELTAPPDAALMLFVDGKMDACPVADYALLALPDAPSA